MDKLLEKYFVKKYPKIFRDMYGPMDQTCMHWGIECGAGWFLLLDNLCHNIQNHIDSHNKYAAKDQPKIPQLVALQIKQKFGELTIYYKGGDEYCHGMISMAQFISYSICENCGTFNENVGRTKGWIQSLCPACAKEYGKEIVQDKKLQALMKKVVKGRKIPTRSWQTVYDLAKGK
jgi:hypothetical protein